MSSDRRIVIAFFGITRALRLTLPSIEANILAPARAVGRVSTTAHLYDLSAVVNPRTGENTAVDRKDALRLGADRLVQETPGAPLADLPVARIEAFGDTWLDQFRTLHNLLHQLHSLKVVTRAALDEGAEIVAFCRPDLTYHDSFAPDLARALEARASCAFLPHWQRHKGGFNDRFALCVGRAAIEAYGNRLDLALSFCKATGLPLQSERLLRFALVRAAVPTRRLHVRASRVRADGRVVDEDFRALRWKDLRNSLRLKLTQGF